MGPGLSRNGRNGRNGLADVQAIMDDFNGGGAALPQLLAPTLVYASKGFCAAEMRLVCKAFKNELDLTIKEWTAEFGRALEDYLVSKRLRLSCGLNSDKRDKIERLYKGCPQREIDEEEESLVFTTTTKFLRIVQQCGKRSANGGASSDTACTDDVMYPSRSQTSEEKDTFEMRRTVWKEICEAQGGMRRAWALFAGKFLDYIDAHQTVLNNLTALLQNGIGRDQWQAVRKWFEMQQPWSWNKRIAPDATSVRFYLTLVGGARGRGCQLCNVPRHFRCLDEDTREYIRNTGYISGMQQIFTDEAELMTLDTKDANLRLVRAHPSCLLQCCVPIDFLHKWRRNSAPLPCEAQTRKYFESIGAGQGEKHRFRFSADDLNIMTTLDTTLLMPNGLSWFRAAGGTLMEDIDGLQGVKTFASAARISEARLTVAGRTLRMQREAMDAMAETQRLMAAQVVEDQVDCLLGFTWNNGQRSAAAPWFEHVNTPLENMRSVLAHECMQRYLPSVHYTTLLDVTRVSKHVAAAKLQRVLHEQLPKLWKYDGTHNQGSHASSAAYAHIFGLDVLGHNLADSEKIDGLLARLCPVIRDEDLGCDDSYEDDLAWERAVTLLHAFDAIRSPLQLSLNAIGEGRCRWTVFYESTVEITGVVVIPNRDSVWWRAMKWFGSVEDIGPGSVSHAYSEFNKRGLKLAAYASGEDFGRTTSTPIQQSFCEGVTMLCRTTIVHDLQRRGLALYALTMGDTASLLEAVSRTDVSVEVMRTFAQFGFE